MISLQGWVLDVPLLLVVGFFERRQAWEPEGAVVPLLLPIMVPRKAKCETQFSIHQSRIMVV